MTVHGQNVVLDLSGMLNGADGAREVRFNNERMRASGIEKVSILGIGPVHAAIALLFVRLPDIDGNQVWQFTASPYSESLLKRLMAKRLNPLQDGRTSMGTGLDVLSPSAMDVSYDAKHALQKFAEGLAGMNQPVGAYVEIFFGINTDSVPVVDVRGSSVELIQRDRGLAIQHNDKEKNRFWWNHFPFGAPRTVWGMQIWPWYKVRPLALRDERKIPSTDPWGTDGAAFIALQKHVSNSLGNVLKSLWKAAFMEDKEVVDQLLKLGYSLEGVEKTRLGGGVLLDLMRESRKKGGLVGQADMSPVVKQLARNR
jgi:hypothetical protein